MKKLMTSVGFLLLSVFFLSACFETTPSLSLAVTAPPETLEQGITLTLANPDRCRLFVPADWAGVEMFLRDAQGNWIEYLNRHKVVPMLTTQAAELDYSIPAGTLPPGTYKLVLRGRAGDKGHPFTLETLLDLSPHNSEGS